MSSIYKNHCEECGKYYEGWGKCFCSRLCYVRSMSAAAKLLQEKRFWAGVRIEDLFSCWIWTRGLNGDGYGSTRWDGRDQSAHRVSYSICVGKIPDAVCCLHRCDIKACVNPAHLFLGTRTDNMRDMSAKERGMNKLTGDSVRSILNLLGKGRTGASLARQFGVSNATICLINTGKHWKHIERGG